MRKHNKYKSWRDSSEWLDQKALLREKQDCYYIYQQEFQLDNNKTYTRTGIIGLVRLEEFSKGIILPHENTLSKPKADRLQLMRACNANFSQVFGLYDDSKQEIPTLIKDCFINHKPDIVLEKSVVGSIERIWIVDDAALTQKISEAFKGKKIYIADGHHRYETALAYRDELKSKNPNHTGKELYNYVMMTLVDMEDPGLVVLPTHRMVNNIKNFDLDSLLEKFDKNFIVEEYKVENYSLTKKQQTIQEILDKMGLHTFVLYSGERQSLYSLSLKSIDIMKEFHPNRHRSYLDLDVSILHTLILDELLGIGEKS